MDRTTHTYTEMFKFAAETGTQAQLSALVTSLVNEWADVDMRPTMWFAGDPPNAFVSLTDKGGNKMYGLICYHIASNTWSLNT